MVFPMNNAFRHLIRSWVFFVWLTAHGGGGHAYHKKRDDNDYNDKGNDTHKVRSADWSRAAKK